MKAYVISDRKELGIAMSNAISANNIAAIISEMGSSDYKEMLQDAADNIGNYDFTTMLSAQAFEANMRANRNSRLRAVVCRSALDAAKARRANANLIIVDSNGFTKDQGANIVRGWTSAASRAVEESEERGEQSELKERGIGIFGSGRQMIGSLKKTTVAVAKAKPQKAKPEPEEVESSNPAEPKRGILGRIKYTFGLED